MRNLREIFASIARVTQHVAPDAIPYVSTIYAHMQAGEFSYSRGDVASDIKNGLVPMVVEQTKNGERSYDIFSRLMQDRVILLDSQVDAVSASVVSAQLLFLNAAHPGKDVFLYIDSPGGSVTAGMNIYDTMQYIQGDVVTIGRGMCASMGSFLAAAGAPRKRLMLPNLLTMVHQPSGGSQGQETEMRIAADNIDDLRERMEYIYLFHMGMDGNNPEHREAMHNLCERDTYLTAVEAQDLGLGDVIQTYEGKGPSAAHQKKLSNYILEFDRRKALERISTDKKRGPIIDRVRQLRQQHLAANPA